MADRARVIILLILSATMIFSQNCQNSGFMALDGSDVFASTVRLSMSQNMERPSFDKLKVGVFYTPYNKTVLGYDGNRPQAYRGNSIHDFKKKPFNQWPEPGAMMYAEMPWLGTFNVEGYSVANPEVGDLATQAVFKYHAQWLYSMGTDFIIWDSTNHAWLEKGISDESLAMVRDPLVKLLDSWLELRKQGISTPQVAIWAPIPGIKKGTYFIKTLLDVIDTPKYSELIFRYKDKPLVMVVASDHPDILAGRDASGNYHEPDPTIMAELKSRYTVREMWANELAGGNNWSYLQKCTDSSGAELTPYRTQTECNQRISPDPTLSDRVEQIPVTFAYGRDHVSNRQSATGKRKGYTILRQMETVFKNRQDVDIVTISWFNTWAAVQVSPLCIPNHPTGLYNCVTQDGRSAYANGISAPQAANGGHTLAFTDDYDEEYSVTFEPGGVTGDYYMRLMNQALMKIAAGRNPMELYDPEIFSIKGAVNAKVQDSTITGWACVKGSSNSIQVKLTSNKGDIGVVRADQSLEKVAPDAVADIQGRCESSRKYHGFVYKLTDAQKTSLSGAVVTAMGLTDSEYFSDAALTGSATLSSGVVTQPTPTPAPSASPTPSPTVAPTCSNGANNYPTCNTCSSGKVYNGSSCQAALCTPNASESCSVPNGTGIKSCNSQGNGYTSCVTVSCNSGYSLSGGACIVTPAQPAGGIVQIYRYRNTVEMGHVFTTSASVPSSQYVSEGPAYRLYDQPASGRVTIYRCKVPGSSREFQSTYSNCEGQQSYGVLGYASQSGGAALYRCFHAAGGHLFTTNRSECDYSGYTVESILGYTP